MKKIVFVLGSLLINQLNLYAQKGQLNIAAGPLLSIPTDRISRQYKVGYGAEVYGQYGLSLNSSAVAQLAVLHYAPKNWAYWADPFTDLNVKGGYRYQFGTSGIYANGLAGVAIDLSDGFASIAITLGGGKRFTFSNGRRLDVGLDYVTGDVWVNAVNIKAAVFLFNKQRVKE